nr:immunoglobulin heavy chain junction region [Macaca mulatta]MOV47436.1 immunoglobulin heavy chain junction region [Macaca mulatta]MOV47447.1 immunoglobulin heavy chain junction region [Macaca mulatta]MOV47503.1 immunoglobulin heavy chain junction region [Macaca mulatta]MOV47537.1 immunoglobulin heavy chain junction region [Macaca mulatta]
CARGFFWSVFSLDVW